MTIIFPDENREEETSGESGAQHYHKVEFRQFGKYFCPQELKSPLFCINLKTLIN